MLAQQSLTFVRPVPMSNCWRGWPIWSAIHGICRIGDVDSHDSDVRGVQPFSAHGARSDGGAQVRILITQGSATELDKGLIEKITDPLTHLLRNSVDHGIETRADGWPQASLERGTVTLSASHQGGSIVIEVRDDGRGLSREKILAKARTLGLAADEQLSDQDVWQLIFTPGFSTAQDVTDVLWPWRGMDVVKRKYRLPSWAVLAEIDSVTGLAREQLCVCR